MIAREPEKVPVYYVLVPLPSKNMGDCLCPPGNTKSPGFEYLEKTGCDKRNRLPQDSISDLIKLGNTLIYRLANSKNGQRTVHDKVITFADTEILKNLGPDDVLYVTAHGCPYAIGTAGPGVNLSPELLAKTLKNAGLSRNLRTLKIMTCDSAIDAETIAVYGNSDLKPDLPNGQVKSFAELFQRAMQAGEAGYRNLDVAGYLGETADTVKAKNQNNLHSQVMFFSSGNQNTRASAARLWFLSPDTKRDVAKIKESNAETLAMIKQENTLFEDYSKPEKPRKPKATK